MASRSEILREGVRLVERELLHDRKQRKAGAVVLAEEAFDEDVSFVREIEAAKKQTRAKLA